MAERTAMEGLALQGNRWNEYAQRIMVSYNWLVNMVNMLNMLLVDIWGRVVEFFRGRVVEFFRGFIIFPDNRWYVLWEILMFISTIAFSVLIPWELCFFKNTPKTLNVANMVYLSLMILDISLRFFVAYKDALTYEFVCSHKQISVRYLRSYFTFDVIGLIPLFHWIFEKTLPNWTRFFAFVTLIRMQKLHHFLLRVQGDRRVNYRLVKFLQFISLEIFFIHIGACFFNLITTYEEEKTSWTRDFSEFHEMSIWKRYLTSAYLTTITVSTVGYGDLHPVTMTEMLFVIIFVLIHWFMGVYLAGQLSTIFDTRTRTRVYRDALAEGESFLTRYGVNTNVLNHFRAELRQRFDTYYQMDLDFENLSTISTTTREMISLDIKRQYVERVGHLLRWSPNMVDMITNQTGMLYIPAQHVIIKRGTVSARVFIVCYGILENLDGDGAVVSEIRHPNIVGYQEQAEGNHFQHYTVRARTHCRVLYMDSMAYHHVAVLEPLEEDNNYAN